MRKGTYLTTDEHSHRVPDVVNVSDRVTTIKLKANKTMHITSAYNFSFAMRMHEQTPVCELLIHVISHVMIAMVAGHMFLPVAHVSMHGTRDCSHFFS